MPVAGKYKVIVKKVDILGIDTSQIKEGDSWKINLKSPFPLCELSIQS